jgi:exodeoxyribonuclease V alpha subunit
VIRRRWPSQKFAAQDTLERVTFRNEENGFCVLRVKARGQRNLIPSSDMVR